MTTTPDNPPLSLGACATLACVWEATAPKPGNVHRGADFADMTYADFLTSAVVIGPVIDRCGELGLGRTVLEGVKATRDAVGVNTNLGTILLIAPLATPASVEDSPWRTGGPEIVIESATVEDTRAIYEAIRLASPGGLGTVEEGDVAGTPSLSVLEAMQLAADRDLVARQYTNDFAEVRWAADEIEKWMGLGLSLSKAIVETQLRLIANHGDSLVARKLGAAASRELSDRAGRLIASDAMDREVGGEALADLDFWLRADGNRRNPGTTADLLAAALFVLLVGNRLSWPVKYY